VAPLAAADEFSWQITADALAAIGARDSDRPMTTNRL
jgi:hypothetical protein